MLACKFNDDLKLSNESFGKLGGVSAAELELLELEFLYALGFAMNVSAETFAGYFRLILGHPASI